VAVALPTPTPTRHRWPVLALLLTAVFLDLLDGTIVGVALPRIRADLAAGPATTQWILAGYALAFALVLIPGGRLGDLVGRKRVFLVGMIGFGAASVAAGAATGPATLIAARLAQGACAGLMVPPVLAMITVLFAGAARATALTCYGIALSLANVSGPLLGGVLTEYGPLGLGWRSIFLVNVPVVAAAAAGCLRYLPESRSTLPLRPDPAGTVLLGLASVLVLVPLVGNRIGWQLALAAPVLVAFVAVQRRRGGHALVPPVLFRHRSFAVGLAVLAMLFAGVGSLLLVLSYGLQDGWHWSPLRTAAIALAWPVGIVATSGIARRAAARHGRTSIAAGLALLAASTAGLAAGLDRYGAGWVTVGLPLLSMGLGMGLCVAILTGVVLTGVPDEHAGSASGVLNTVIQLGTALGIAVIGGRYFAGTDPATAMPPALAGTAGVVAGAAALALLLPRRRAPGPDRLGR
jgi:MFS family permease